MNLGLDSFVFVDDSAHECAAVRHRLPEVEVIQTPAKPIQIPTCLDRVGRLEILSLTGEDLAKTQMYAQEKLRRQFIGGSSEDYLASLKMTVKVCFGETKHLTRLAQLTQKTNQFNLTTRRYDVQQMQQFMGARNWIVADFSLADIFGESGIVGLALVRLEDGAQAQLDTFLMSCRVIGREAESAFLNTVLRRLAELGIIQVFATYIPTRKNGLVANFLPQHAFESLGEGRYMRDLRKHPPRGCHTYPIAVSIHSASPDRLSTTNP